MIFGIVGHGRFGKLWAKALLPFGSVKIYDNALVSQTKDEQIKITTLQEVAQAEVIFLLVPISAFENVCAQIKEFLNPDSLVVDCCSVKMHPIAVMQHIFQKTQPLMATHPLFGPDSVKKTNGFQGHKIVVCPMNSAKNQQKQLEDIFKKMGLQVIITTPEEHDKQMANSQGLVHFIGRGLAALTLQSQELATPDFQALLNIDHMVMHDSWQLFLDMHRYNPYTKNIRQKLIDQLTTLNCKIDEEN